MSQQQNKLTLQLVLKVDIPLLSDEYVQEVRSVIEDKTESMMCDVSRYYGVAWGTEWKVD